VPTIVFYFKQRRTGYGVQVVAEGTKQLINHAYLPAAKVSPLLNGLCNYCSGYNDLPVYINATEID